VKFATSGMAAHIAQGQTTLAACLILVLVDGTVMGFTEHDRDIVYTPLGGPSPPLISMSTITFKASAGFTKLNRNARSQGVDHGTQIDGSIDGTVVTRADLEARRYDFASAQIIFVNWQTLSEGAIIDFTGMFGPVTINEFGFSVDLRPLSYLLTRTGGEWCCPDCRVDFGSPRCAPGGALADGTTIDSLMQSGAVVSTDGFKTLVVSGISNTGRIFNKSLLTWTSGNNLNISHEVKSIDFATSTITLSLKTDLLIAAGDTFELMPGCDLTLVTCSGTYNNAVNHQGDALVPGPDHERQYPDFHEPHT
jgi:uncharacterized phage protein (TIGR02218 family)